MGTVAKRIVLLVAVVAMAVPGMGRASTTTEYTPTYELGPQGGDSNNTFMVDAETGEMTAIRHQLSGVNGSLGCGGNGGFTYFSVTHDAAETPTSVTASYDSALVDPYTFVKLVAVQGGRPIGVTNLRGVVLGSGEISLALEGAHAAQAGEPLTLWFGIEISSACPGLDGGTLTFTKVAVTEG